MGKMKISSESIPASSEVFGFGSRIRISYGIGIGSGIGFGIKIGSDIEIDSEITIGFETESVLASS